jgi:hypothetical protein
VTPQLRAQLAWPPPRRLDLTDDADLHVMDQQRQPEAGTGFTDIGGGSKQKFRADGRAMASRQRAAAPIMKIQPGVVNHFISRNAK